MYYEVEVDISLNASDEYYDSISKNLGFVEADTYDIAYKKAKDILDEYCIANEHYELTESVFGSSFAQHYDYSVSVNEVNIETYFKENILKNRCETPSEYINNCYGKDASLNKDMIKNICKYYIDMRYDSLIRYKKIEHIDINFIEDNSHYMYDDIVKYVEMYLDSLKLKYRRLR